MNSIPTFSCAEPISADCTAIPKLDVEEIHVLRSKIIGKCASVESWLVDNIQPYQTPSPTFSGKMKQVSELLDKHPKKFNNPKKLLTYLKEFRPFAIFRSELAHSKMTEYYSAEGKTILAFQNAVAGSDLKTAKSILISCEELRQIWNEMCSAANKLTNYTIIPPS